MYNPFKGVSWGNPFDWVYVLLVLASPVIGLLCLATIWGPGWFIGAFYWFLLCETEPPETQLYREERRRVRKLRQRRYYYCANPTCKNRRKRFLSGGQPSTICLECGNDLVFGRNMPLSEQPTGEFPSLGPNR